MGGNFDLRFSRCRAWHESPSNAQESSHDAFNPHDDAEPFLRHILRQGQGRLAPSLHRLVTLLRDTLPIVIELEEIRRTSHDAGQHLDTFAKAAGWYRLLYLDTRCDLSYTFSHPSLLISMV